MPDQRTATCRECGASYQAKKASSSFCSAKCRQSWNNRRAVRGAELYDLFMTMRFDRQIGNEQKVWTLMCAVAGAYRDADKVLRESRKSWDAKAFLRIPMAYGKAGDGR